MSNPMLLKAVEDVNNLVSEGLAALQEKPRDKWTPNEFKNLEILNRALTVCLDRENKKPAKNAFDDKSIEELESVFD